MTTSEDLTVVGLVEFHDQFAIEYTPDDRLMSVKHIPSGITVSFDVHQRELRDRNSTEIAAIIRVRVHEGLVRYIKGMPRLLGG